MKIQNPNLKKSVLVLLLAAMCALSIAGCGGEDPSQGQPAEDSEKTQDGAEKQPDVSQVDKSNYFKSEEAVYRGVEAMVTETELVATVGMPNEVLPADEFSSSTYVYDDATYSFVQLYNEDGSMGDRTRLSVITITSPEYPTIRDISVGDSLERVLAKFPKEKDYKTEGGQLFGEDTLDGHGGMLLDEGNGGQVVILTSEEIDPFVKIQIKDGIVQAVNIYMFRIM